MNNPGEYGECAWLWSHYREYFLVPQYYVDVGCADPIVGSNTAWLRDIGWKGLHIDGDSSWIPKWNGQMIHAVIHTDPEVYFESNPVACLSRCGDAPPNTQTKRLDQILFANNVDRIGFMSIDCEGKEFEVLESMDRFPTLPPFIVSEYNTAGIGEDFRVRDYLTERGFQVVYQTIANLIYYDESRCSN